MLALAGCGLIGGCALGKEVTAFPPGLEPLEANTAEWPDATDGARYPEEQNLNTGDAEDEELGVDYSWSHGRGYIQMPINKVYQALVVPRVNADRREIDSYEVTWDVEPDYPHSYVLSNVVNDVLTIEFDVTWRHGATAGSEDEPEQIGTRWQKTEGSTVIEILRGSVRTFPVSDDELPPPVIGRCTELALGSSVLADTREFFELAGFLGTEGEDEDSVLLTAPGLSLALRSAARVWVRVGRAARSRSWSMACCSASAAY
jgi:hypothetical protein